MPEPIPDPLIAFLVVSENMRCPDCEGFTVQAGAYGATGRFCSCEYDRDHL